MVYELIKVSELEPRLVNHSFGYTINSIERDIIMHHLEQYICFHSGWDNMLIPGSLSLGVIMESAVGRGKYLIGCHMLLWPTELSSTDEILTFLYDQYPLKKPLLWNLGRHYKFLYKVKSISQVEGKGWEEGNNIFWVYQIHASKLNIIHNNLEILISYPYFISEEIEGEENLNKVT